MKTILALILSLAITSIAIAGPEPMPPVKGPTPAPASYFKAGEWDLSLGGLGSWTQTAHAQDRYLGLDKAFGGTADAKYFLTNNFGGGLSFSGYDAGNSTSVQSGFLGQKLPGGILAAGTSGFVGDVLLKLVARYPIGQFAPYVYVGGGAIFNGGNSTLKQPVGSTGKILQFEAIEHDVKMLVEPGAGVEFRVTPNIGFFVEGAFDKIDRPQSNYFSARTGITFAF